MILTLEIGILAFAFASLLAFVSPWPSNHLLLAALLAIAGCLVAVHLVVFHLRWQLMPVFIVLAILSIVFLLNWEPGRAAGLVFGVGGTVLVAFSTLLSFGFPVRALPQPDGPYSVGVLTTDREYFPDQGSKEGQTHIRRLQLKVWYPAKAKPANSYIRETLWSEFNDGESFSPIERFFAAYLKNMKTHAFQKAPLDAGGAKRPILIYNHALLSTASDNTFLVESLASHGYVIVGIRHKDQRSEFATLQNMLSKEERAAEVTKLRRLGDKTLDRHERANRAMAAYQENKTMRAIVKRRARDTEFVLNNLASILDAIPGCVDGICVEGDKIGLVGLSLGGAVGTEFCKSDQRCSALVNLDGGIFGTDITAPVPVPYLMLYSENNEGGNDFAETARNETYEEHVIPGAEHMNFHDASVVLPGLKYVGLLGAIDGDHMNRVRNQIVLEFLDRRL